MQAVVDDANPRAVVRDSSARASRSPTPSPPATSWSTPPTTRSSTASGPALLVGGALAVVALVAGYLVFPKGPRDESEEEHEAERLEAEEEVP